LGNERIFSLHVSSIPLALNRLQLLAAASEHRLTVSG
jgi:hypothetical protein